MNRILNICKKSIGVTLLLVFLFPTVLQFEHLFDQHEHVSCSDYSLHLHEKNNDCKVHDFHFSPFQFDLAFDFEALPNFPSRQENTIEWEAFKSNNPLTLYLRGPPLNS